ncbi:response regulator [Methylolobus aquaticus]
MKKILLVENDPALRKLTSQLLRLEGYEVLEAENGRAGLDLVADGQPDLVLCDLLMPELDGRQVLRALRRDPQFASLPLVFLTASAAAADREACLAEGAAGFVTKPFEQTTLLALIDRLLQ